MRHFHRYKVASPLRLMVSVVCVASLPTALAYGNPAQPGTATLLPRPYFNDQRCPRNAGDLLAIQDKLQKSFQDVRKAVVCIQLENGAGSGVIISKAGLVLTAAHVVALPGTSLTVVTEDGKEYPAKALGLNSETDSAMVQIEEKADFPYVEVDFSGSSRVGDWTFSLGYSGGFDKERGTVLRLGRIIRTGSDVILTDSPLIGGDSGGGLFDIHGVLIGIHSRVGNAKEANFHVPLTSFDRNWDRLAQGEFIGDGPFAERPKPGSGFLGVGVEDAEGEEGPVVTKVIERSAAEKAGIEVGDHILLIDEVKIEDSETLIETISQYVSGTEIKVVILKNGEKMDLHIKLGPRPG